MQGAGGLQVRQTRADVRLFQSQARAAFWGAQRPVPHEGQASVPRRPLPLAGTGTYVPVHSQSCS
eukprot:7485169-Lingulodinium_polyedra.AAC.1